MNKRLGGQVLRCNPQNKISYLGRIVVNLHIFFFFFFWPLHAHAQHAGILVPQRGMERMPPAVEAQSLNH